MAKANISNVPKAEPTMPKWILYLVFMTVIVFIFLGIKNYRSTRQLDTSDFQGQQWQRWILGPGKSSKVIMNNPRLITVESLGPNYIFSMSYIYKGKKEIAVYTWNSEKEEYGCWSQTNPPKKGFWWVKKMSPGYYSGWTNMGDIEEQKATMWLTGPTGKEANK